MEAGKLVWVILLTLLFITSAAGFALSSGGAAIQGAAKRGCTDFATGCHRAEADPAVMYSISGVPEKYEPGKTYTLHIALQGPPSEGENQGGFALTASAGELSVPAGAKDVQVNNNEATHTADGNKKREWEVEWTAPEKGAGDVLFYGAVNAVNGNAVNDQEDRWNTFITVSQGEKKEVPGEGAGEAGVASFGVPILAHWVGIVSMVASFLIVIVAFFLLKFGESRHTVDHTDRKK
jgi:hypothetical protein